MVELIREAYAARRDLFHSDAPVTMSTRHLFSFRSLSQLSGYLFQKEVRSLQRGGLPVFQRFYKSRLAVDFKNFAGDFDQIVEYHERRHLFVHRLGRTDSRYRKLYDTGAETVNVGKRYVTTAFTLLTQFAEFLDSEVSRSLVSHHPEPLHRSYLSSLAVRIHLLAPTARDRLLARHSIITGEDVIDFADLVTSFALLDSGLHQVEFRGSRAQLGAALKVIKRIKREGLLTIDSVTFDHPTKLRSNNVSGRLLDEIAKHVRERPIPLARRLEIAERFDIRPKQASRAIRQINQWPTESVMDRVRAAAPPAPWPPDLHQQVAELIGIPPRQAFEALRRISWERRSGPTAPSRKEDSAAEI
jgi:hypothetical protein